MIPSYDANVRGCYLNRDGTPGEPFGYYLLPTNKSRTLQWDSATLSSQSVPATDPQLKQEGYTLATQPFVSCHPPIFLPGHPPFSGPSLSPAGGRFEVWGKARGDVLLSIPGYYEPRPDDKSGVVEGSITWSGIRSDDPAQDGDLELALQKLVDGKWVDIPGARASSVRNRSELRVSARVESDTEVQLVARVGRQHGAHAYVFGYARLFVPTCVLDENTGKCR
jgi:hypothetical protein